jgi:fucose permease
MEKKPFGKLTWRKFLVFFCESLLVFILCHVFAKQDFDLIVEYCVGFFTGSCLAEMFWGD